MNNPDNQTSLLKRITTNGLSRKGLLFFTLVTISIYGFIYYNKSNYVVDPALYMNDKLTPSQQLKVKIHSQHHSEEDTERLVMLLEQGKTWKQAHSVLKPMSMFHHFRHIDIEIMHLLIESLFITTGLLFAFNIQSVIDIFKPESKTLAAWYYLLCFSTVLIIFSFFIMTMKHSLSFRTFNESMFY